MLAYEGEQRPRTDVARPESIVPGGEEGEGEKEVEAMWRRWEGAAGLRRQAAHSKSFGVRALMK